MKIEKKVELSDDRGNIVVSLIDNRVDDITIYSNLTFEETVIAINKLYGEYQDHLFVKRAVKESDEMEVKAISDTLSDYGVSSEEVKMATLNPEHLGLLKQINNELKNPRLVKEVPLNDSSFNYMPDEIVPVKEVIEEFVPDEKYLSLSNEDVFAEEDIEEGKKKEDPSEFAKMFEQMKDMMKTMLESKKPEDTRQNLKDALNMRVVETYDDKPRIGAAPSYARSSVTEGSALMDEKGNN